MRKLHPKQAAILEILKENIDDPLTIREIGAAMNDESPGVIHHHILQLEKKGFLKRNPSNPKDYVVLDTPERKIVYINKYGAGQCGPEGIMLEDNIIDRIPIASILLKFPAEEAFILEARGDSMKPKIYEGDVVIARRQTIPENNDIVVCSYQEKVLIKKFMKSESNIVLVSLNPNYDPIVANLEDLKIAGIVKNVLHYG